jgi:hypothetical protein
MTLSRALARGLLPPVVALACASCAGVSHPEADGRRFASLAECRFALHLPQPLPGVDDSAEGWTIVEARVAAGSEAPAATRPVGVPIFVNLDGAMPQDLHIAYRDSCSGWGDCEHALLLGCGGERYQMIWGPEYAAEVSVGLQRDGRFADFTVAEVVADWDCYGVQRTQWAHVHGQYKAISTWSGHEATGVARD